MLADCVFREYLYQYIPKNNW